MGLFNWLFQGDQREEEREIADRHASPLAHDWRDLGPVGRPARHGAGDLDEFDGHQGPTINPATGLPMLNEVFDIHHNHFGVSEDIGGMDSLTGMDGGIDSFGDMGGCDGRW